MPLLLMYIPNGMHWRNPGRWAGWKKKEEEEVPCSSGSRPSINSVRYDGLF